MRNIPPVICLLYLFFNPQCHIAHLLKLFKSIEKFESLKNKTELNVNKHTLNDSISAKGIPDAMKKKIE